MARLSASSSAAHGDISARDATSATTPSSHIPTAATAAEHDTPVVTVTTPADDSQDEAEDAIDTAPVPMDETLYPGGSRDLSSIGFQAFSLGFTCSLGLTLTAYLVSIGSSWWRVPTFFGTLSLFHFLEYWTQARYNTPALRADSFLLFSNGRHYNIAHGLATTEAFISCAFPIYGQALVTPWTIAIGVGLVILGQVVRSVAMGQAGVSFNHVVAREHKETHKLVTHGVYAHFRHPSYFGFFWWAIGTQFLIGNKVCLVGYAIVVWKFFSMRIRGEERFLVDFFGDKYEEYRRRVGTKIPFIR